MKAACAEEDVVDSWNEYIYKFVVAEARSPSVSIPMRDVCAKCVEAENTKIGKSCKKVIRRRRCWGSAGSIAR